MALSFAAGYIAKGALEEKPSNRTPIASTVAEKPKKAIELKQNPEVEQKAEKPKVDSEPPKDAKKEQPTNLEKGNEPSKSGSCEQKGTNQIDITLTMDSRTKSVEIMRGLFMDFGLINLNLLRKEAKIAGQMSGICDQSSGMQFTISAENPSVMTAMLVNATVSGTGVEIQLRIDLVQMSTTGIKLRLTTSDAKKIDGAGQKNIPNGNFDAI